MNDELVKLKPEREKARYQEIYTEADTKIQDSEHTLQSEKAKAEKELTDAKAQLDSSAAQLQNAKRAGCKRSEPQQSDCCSKHEF